MPRVAVIGCSFSDNNHQDNNWTQLLANTYPTINFYNYSRGGMGHLYQDMCLKHALYVEAYDYIIVQCTGSLRWHTPAWLDQDVSDIDPSGTFLAQRHTSNLTVMRLVEATNQMIAGDLVVQDDDDYDDSVKHRPWRSGYTGLYFRQLEALAEVHKLSYFSFPNFKFIKNNIGHYTDVWAWFELRMGETKFLETCVDDTLHLNDHGNKLLHDYYILESKIKLILEDLS